MNSRLHLFRRNGVYYFRARLPTELLQTLGKREIKRSLRTDSLAEAIKRSRPLIALISRLRTMSDIERILRQLQDAGLSSNEATRKIGSISKAGFEIKNIEVDPATPGDVEALLKVIDSLGAADEERLTKSPPSSMMLSEAIDKYVAYYSKLPKENMLSKIKSVVQTLFIDIIGDKPINELNQEDLSMFFDEAQKLPKTWISGYLKGQSIASIIKEHDGKPGLSFSTLSTPYKAALNGFLGWSHNRFSHLGFPKLTVTSYDITYLGEIDEDGGSGQRSFNHDELKKLFECPTSLKDANSTRDVHRYWLILIGLHTGARIREICQINPQRDIKDVGGIPCFQITRLTTEEKKDPEVMAKEDPEVIKKLKTIKSKRNIPIHPRLIELGMLEYVKCLVEADAKRLFPLFSVKNGNAGAEPGRQFIRQLKALELRDETPGAKLVGFHAFRHTFITYAHNHDIKNYWEITGHDDKDIPETAKVYRGEKDAPKLLELIKQFKFDIDFARPVSLAPDELKRLIR